METGGRAGGGAAGGQAVGPLGGREGRKNGIDGRDGRNEMVREEGASAIVVVKIEPMNEQIRCFRVCEIESDGRGAKRRGIK